MNSNDKITVMYFPGNYKAFPIRAMLETSKVAYTNRLITFEEWGKMEKPSDVFEYGFLPVLEVNGKHYSQALAIYYYLGRKLGYLGENLEEEVEVLNVLASFEDISPKFIPVLFHQGSDEEKGKMLKDIANDHLTWILPILNRKVTNKKGKYLVGDKLTLADIMFAFFFHLLTVGKGVIKDVVEKHASDLLKYGESILNNELKDFKNGGYIKDMFI